MGEFVSVACRSAKTTGHGDDGPAGDLAAGNFVELGLNIADGDFGGESVQALRAPLGFELVPNSSSPVDGQLHRVDSQ